MSFNVNGIPIAANPISAIQEIADLVHALQVSRFVTIAGFIVLVYDHLLTFNEEIEFIWKRPKNLVSSIFLVNRYLTPPILILDLYTQLGLAPSLSVGLCQYWVVIEVILHLLSHASIHAIVAIRVNALWGDQPRIKWSLFALWLSYLTIGLTIAIKAVFEDKDTFSPNPIVHSCVGVVGDFVWSVWVSPLVLEFILFGLTVAKAARHSSKTIATMPIAYVLYRDGIMYFLVISMCSALNLVVWEALPVQWFTLAKNFTLGMVNAMGARMVLNLRSLGGVRYDNKTPSVFFADSTLPRFAHSGGSGGPGYTIELESRAVPLRDLSNSKARRHHPYGDLGAPSKAAAKKEKTDPYFYERQANRLRHLRVNRPDFGKWTSFKMARSGGVPTIPLSAGAVSGPSHLEESIAKEAMTPKSGSSRRTSWGTGVSAIEEYDDEIYDWESYPLPTVSTIERKIELEECKSSEASLASPY